jgi:hypothetical protein
MDKATLCRACAGDDRDVLSTQCRRGRCEFIVELGCGPGFESAARISVLQGKLWRRIPFGRGVIVNGAIAGVPTAPGNYDVVISVTDNGAPAQQSSAAYTITIAPPPPPSVNVTPAPAIGTLNSPYTGFSFTATYGLPPLSWSESGPCLLVWYSTRLACYPGYRRQLARSPFQSRQ